MHTCDAYGVDIFVNFCRDTTTDSSCNSALAKVRTYYGTQYFVITLGISFRWINGDTGRRSDAAHHSLYPHVTNPNLDIITGCSVRRVIFEYVACEVSVPPSRYLI